MHKRVGIRPAKPTKRVSVDRTAAKRTGEPRRGKRQLNEIEREQFFALSPDMLCIAGDDGYFRWVNPAFTKALGWSAAELMAKPFVTFIHPDDRAGIQAEIGRQIDGREKALNFENRYRHKDGSWRALSWTSVAHGDLTYAIARDESERSRLQHALQGANVEVEHHVSARTAALVVEVEERRRAERKFKALLDAAPDAMVITNGAGEILIVNTQAEIMFDYAKAELIGEKIEVLVPVRFHDRHPAHRAAYFASPAVRPMGIDRELHGRRKDGSEFPVEIRLGPLETEEGILVSSAIRDITERQAMEAQLRQAVKMEAVGHLTGGVAHDFNNLLGVMIGNLDLLLEDAHKDPKTLRYTHGALNAALAGAELTQRLLAFSRKQPLAPKAFDLNARLAPLVTMLQRTMREKIVFQLHPGADVWPALADPAQLDEAILNLAINARDAMPEGGKLTMETSSVRLDADYAARNIDVTPGDYVLLTVSDTGIGIPSEVLERVFEPFFTTKEPGKGTGLGLSMVYGFIKQSNGHIKIYSEVGRGTVVKIYLPRAQTVEAAAMAREQEPEVSRDHELVLVVEDNADMRAVAVAQLADLGYRVLEADSAKAALAMLEKRRNIDLLFSDVIMPGGMSGFELVVEARAKYPKLKMLLTSGYTAKAMATGIIDLGGAELLNKPYRKYDLAIKLRQVLA